MEIDLSKLDDSLARNLWPCATKVIEHFQKRGYKWTSSEAINKKAPYQFHLVFRRKKETVAVEVRHKCEVPAQLERAVDKCYSDRQAVRVFFAMPDKIIDSSNLDEKKDTIFTHAQRSKLESCGIGLLIVEMDNDEVVVDMDTVAADKKISSPDVTGLGNHKSRIEDLVKSYNSGDFLDSFKELAEISEGETYAVALKAAGKGKLAYTKNQVEKMAWEDVINVLSSDKVVPGGLNFSRTITDPKFTNSLKSHKDKRNLADHKKKAKEFRALEELYQEAMLEGIRVIRGLIRIKNKL